MKLIFELDVEDEWPPVSAESLWFEKTARGYQLKTIPFFMEGVAYDDILDLEIIDGVHGNLKSVKHSSGNSTIWAYFREGVNERAVLSRLHDIGIENEGGALTGYFAINLPANRSFADLRSCMSEELAAGKAELAHGVMRHHN